MDKNKKYDEIIIGCGIMGLVYTFFLNYLEPKKKILLIEKLKAPALEGSFPWNNAGTWHGGNCELNYTPINKKSGKIEIEKALDIHENALKILELISYLKQKKILKKSENIINRTSHLSLVFGDMNGKFLKKRFEAMKKHHFWKDMKFSTNLKNIEKWTSNLITDGRKKDEKLTATLIKNGGCINFGEITTTLYNYLKKNKNITFKFNCEIKKLKKNKNNLFEINKKFFCEKLFVACGGGSLSILQKLKIKEIKDYAGFPVGGEFLICKNQKIAKKLRAKLYGKASVGAPPMSVPHFDTRFIDGKRYLLFGPRATFNPKFLKSGKYSDLIKSITTNNIFPMLSVAKNDFGLVKYLIRETFSGKKKLFNELCEFYPTAKISDWETSRAGQRVQVIKKKEKFGGELKLGTEVLINDKKNVGTLLGASPGATIAPKAMLEMVKKLHEEEFKKLNWEKKIRNIIPSYNFDLKKNKNLYLKIRKKVDVVLKL